MAKRGRAARAVAITLAVGVIAGLAACTATLGGTDNDASAIATAVEHIHGLGADPATGETYAATHNGVWLIPTGALPDTYLTGAQRDTVSEPTQIAGRAQDTMGFTVAGPGLLLGSGHPDPTEQPNLNPPNLGLISSSDGAETWESISLHSETDFHDLATVPLSNGELRIYGYDASDGVVKISDDTGVTWSSGAIVQLRDLLADPSNPDRVFATTRDGLVVSEDAGRSFTGVADAPALFLVDAIDPQAGGGFIGVDTAGAVWHKDATTGFWSKSGQAEGALEAFAYIGGGAPWILVADQRGIVASDDFGASWTVLVP